MKSRAGFFLTCAAAFVGAIAITPQTLAQSAQDITGSSETWFRGYFEVGGRFFANNPQRDGIMSLGGQSLAKFYEYSTLAPGPFADLYLATGSKDGLFRADFWGTNIGYSDQAYWLNLSKAGEHYLTLGWDQTPHVYSTGALTLYNGLGTNALTLPGTLSNDLFLAAGCTRNAGAVPTGCGNLTAGTTAAAVQALINANVHRTDLGIRRDTFSADYRYTPTDAWDIRINYDHLRRTGTQIEGVVFSPGTSGVVSQVPKPVADTTQNFGLSGEYAGTSFWGQKFNLKLAYSGSQFQEDFNSYTVANPFCATASGTTGVGECARTASPSSPLALMSLDPDNQAHGFNAMLGAELPWKSRYMGTISYTMMRQNQAFLPFTGMSQVYTVGNTTLGALPVLPAASLNGAINTLLINNVLTTQISPDLKSKLSYRYYDFKNDTPELFFADWVVTDVKTASTTTAAYAPVRSLSISYTKQNAGAELNWRPSREWNLGAAYGYERYNWARADVNVTNENAGKLFVDWKPTSGITARASWLYSARRYDTYDYLNFVGLFQWPTAGSTRYSTSYRQFYIDNRDRNKGQLSLAIDLMPRLTITPTFGWRYDEYNLNPATEVGLNSDRSWNAGVELAYLVAPGTNFLFSYMYEDHSQLLTSCANNVLPSANCDAVGAQNYYSADVRDKVDTFMVAVNHELIPNKLDVRLGYTFSLARISSPMIFADGTGPTAATGGQYPDVKTTFQRLEAIAKYKFDEDQVRRMGWKGNVTAKLRYVWERNNVTNWQLDTMQTFMFSPITLGTGYMNWMAYDNPNYDVHLIMASLAFAW